MSVIHAIKTRRSTPKLRPDPVARQSLEQMLEAAVWAPNHRMTEPWRFYVLSSDDAKSRFAGMRRQLRATAFPNPDAPEAQKALERIVQDTVATPAIIVVAVHQDADEERREEDTAATFMAIENLMLAGVELNVATYLRTGPIMRDADLRSMLKLEDDRRIVAIVYAGHASDTPQKKRTPAHEKTVWL